MRLNILQLVIIITIIILILNSMIIDVKIGLKSSSLEVISQTTELWGWWYGSSTEYDGNSGCAADAIVVSTWDGPRGAER